jgi:uncharacterized protein YqhQ
MKEKPERVKRVDIGGQAVMEGVMMKGPEAVAIAVRRPDHTIVVRRDTYVSPAKKHPWMGWPFVRGAVSLLTMLSMGMTTLQQSTDMLGVLDEEPTKFELWLSKKLGKGVDKIVMATAVVLAVVLSVGLFFALPELFAKLLKASGRTEHELAGEPAKRRPAHSDPDRLHPLLRAGAGCAAHVRVSRRGA